MHQSCQVNGETEVDKTQTQNYKMYASERAHKHKTRPREEHAYSQMLASEKHNWET